MKNIAVIGGQIGDESKARVIYWMAKSFDYTIRFSGSANCGHTIYDDGKKIVRHLLPSANFSLGNRAFLGSGMVINPDELLEEVQETLKQFPNAASNIIVDPDAFVVFPKHIQEDKEKNKHIGSTNKGVSPAYRDKINRCGFKIRDLLESKHESIVKLQNLGVQFKYVLELKEEFERSRLLFEGGQSVLLDYNFGTYPYVTSGESTLGGIFNAGFAFAMPSKVIGVCKPYVTKVGEGPFPTEYLGEEAEKIRQKGLEFGSTTGRPRRIGALDLPALKYSIIKGGITCLAISKLDILDGEQNIKICVNYDRPLYSGSDLRDNKPQYIEFPGWNNSKNLSQIKPFLSLIENYVNIPVEYVSTGVNPQDMFEIK